MKMRFRLKEANIEVDVQGQGDGWLLSWGNSRSRLRIIRQDGAAFVLEIEELETGERKQVPAAGVKLNGQQRQVWVDGRTETAELLPAFSPPTEDVPPDDTSLSASIPSVVTEILVSIGDEVAANDKLILLESMKMVIPVQAPNAGIVTAIHCAAGDAVEPGVPLIEIEN